MKGKLRKLPKWAAVIVAILVSVGFLAVIRIAGALVSRFLVLPAYGDNMLVEFAGGLYALALLVLFGYSGILKERGAGLLRGCYIGGFLTGYCLIELVAQVYVQKMAGNTVHFSITILFFALTMFLIGWTEEIIFRGVILNLFFDCFSKTKKGILGAILLNGLLFGALHLSNVSSGVTVTSACIQAVTAGMLGVILAATYARTRNIWIVITAHALIDFAGLMGSGIFGNGNEIDGINNISYINLIAVPVLLIPCLVLLRKSKLEELEQRANHMVIFDTYEEADRIATTSLVLGILSIILGCVGYGIGLGVVGLLGSIVSKKIKPAQNVTATAGMITSIAGTVVAVFGIIIMVFIYTMMGNGEMLTNQGIF